MNQDATKKRTQRILYLGLAVSLAMALFFMFKSHSLKKKLQASQEIEAKLLGKEQRQQQLLHIDSMLVKGEYSNALNAYNEAFENKDIEDVAGVQLRIGIARQLLQLKAGTHQDQTAMAKRDSLDSLQMQAAIPKELQRYDSLSFALEKTKIQLANMKRQLQRKSLGEYLMFTNTKGSRMHYVGEVRDQKANGYGVALLNTGSRYEGQWKDNQRHGEGAFYWPDGEYYVGSYLNDKRNGLGTYYWPNGEKYVGQWKDDKRNGKGTFYGKNGEEVTTGVWKDDKLVETDKKEKKNR